MTGATLLVELLTEELPPKALPKLGQAFASAIVAGLRARCHCGTGDAPQRRDLVAGSAAVI